jgi:predicted metal-dependent HD superfamily phosphohydrolase
MPFGSLGSPFGQVKRRGIRDATLGAGMTAVEPSIEAWCALWRRLGARSDPRPLHEEISRAYSEPHRHYHTLEHIAHVLALFDGARDCLRDPDAGELALWLHDFVYDPRARDNEARSAAYAARILDEGGVKPGVANRVTALIMATCHLGPPEDPDARYVVDADLSILGGTPAEFDRYERQVRLEYAFRSEAEWREGRTRILRAFLERPRIFLTSEFDRFESPARANLERSLRHLAAP